MKIKLPDLSYVCATNRYICTVFEEMRECLKSMNFAYLPTLIEEAQMLANRMEAALGDKDAVNSLRDDIKKLKKTRKLIHEEVKELIKKENGHKKSRN